MKINWFNLLSILVWIGVGLYGIFFNITYIDEAKYLIKGWLISSGQVGYYSTPEFFYQHMPGGLLWFGLGQKIFGPSLLTARVQSFLIGLLVMLFSWKLAKLITGKSHQLILPLLSLAPASILYYSSAVPKSLAVLALVLAFYFLFKQKILWATIWFSLSFIVRENFLFTLIFYLTWLFFYLKNKKIWLVNIGLSIFIIGLFSFPGWPGILNVLKNFPGISQWLPINQAEKAVLSLNWQQPIRSFDLYWQAIKEFFLIYCSFILVFIWSLTKRRTYGKRFGFLCFITGFNFLAHTWSAIQLSPRAVVSYFAYITPLGSVIAAAFLAKTKISWRWYLPLLLLSFAVLPWLSLWQPVTKINTIAALTKSSKSLRPIVADKNKIVWLAEPISLYLTGKVSYPPLINHTNFYKPSADTVTVARLGFWNDALIKQWLEEADLVVIDPDRLVFLSQSQQAVPLVRLINNTLSQSYNSLPVNQDSWLGNLQFYIPNSFATR